MEGLSVYVCRGTSVTHLNRGCATRILWLSRYAENAESRVR
jgi:hypothetical protein